MTQGVEVALEDSKSPGFTVRDMEFLSYTLYFDPTFFSEDKHDDLLAKGKRLIGEALAAQGRTLIGSTDWRIDFDDQGVRVLVVEVAVAG